MRKKQSTKYKEYCVRYAKIWRQKNPDKVKLISKKRWLKVLSDEKLHEQHKLSLKKSYVKYREKYSLKKKEFYKLHGRYNWKKVNPIGYREAKRREYLRNQKNPFHRLNNSVSGRIRQSLNGNKNGSPWEKLVGFSLDELKKHIENQFREGMNWNNYGEWHIDHKTPISYFSFETPDEDDFRKCWSLSNLQPLWESENCSKQNRYVG